ncbi:hypothetical protein [Tissierella sp. Yu-01]|uniref:baeRF3 domain-containing protein n=1 Tax=Tissierella sp. Yu-01 TaxID=3035694 RepID=UPI00240D0730|nr:hypothetical protein [Tissierella sp. Yu-01]WFA09472.1 hypothetical protein P3962_02655 [Tissierella sp. Yu-01]
MDILTVQDLQELINKDSKLFISIYLPTYSSGVDIRQNHIKFKQLLREAEAELYNMGMTKKDIEGFLEPAKILITETKFWQEQGDGLAFFIHSDGIKHYRLPIGFQETVKIDQKIYIKPLLPLFTGNGQFNILALSKNQVRLFRCTRQNVQEIELQDAPDSMHDMQVDDDLDSPRRDLALRSSRNVGKNQLTYNNVTQAQSNEDDYERNELTRFFRAIDESLVDMHEGDIVPLILAGVEYLIPIYREKSKYPYIVEDFIRGNPELLNGEELHKLAWEIVEPLFNKDKKLAEDKYKQYQGQRNKLFANSLERIIPAAYSGQIESLFLDNRIQQWGKFDLENNKVEIHEEPKVGDEDLIEYVSLLTLSRGGRVYSVSSDEIPDGSDVAAVLRF